MADPVQKKDIVSQPAAKTPPAAPKAVAPAAKLGQPKPKEAPQKQTGKLRLASLNTNLGRSGVRQESALPVKKVAPKQPVPKKAEPRAKSHYFIIENLCVGCGLCLDKCPPKVNAIGYKFYGDVQEGGFRCYIDQDACISCSACFSADECPSGALIEVLPDGEVLDFTYTPPERLDFDLRFLHRFHREAR